MFFVLCFRFYVINLSNDAHHPAACPETSQSHIASSKHYPAITFQLSTIICQLLSSGLPVFPTSGLLPLLRFYRLYRVTQRCLYCLEAYRNYCKQQSSYNCSNKHPYRNRRTVLIVKQPLTHTIPRYRYGN